MNILIVEDDLNKLRQIAEFFESEIEDVTIEQARSYQSGLKACLSRRPIDLVLLDMTMPTYDVTASEKGGRPRAFAGRDILKEMYRKNIDQKVIVVSQFETFGEAGDTKSLEALTVELRESYPRMFVGSVYYHPSQSDWRSKLRTMITSVLLPND